tara:strand:- start:750 stop:1814 length:1065 start_codon:yes stop_codon:yes gene_type:complete
MNIIFDHSIFSLQRQGGISRWWKHHCLSLAKYDFYYYHTNYYRDNNPHAVALQDMFPTPCKSGHIDKLWPVRRVSVPKTDTPSIFHSSYFRLPEKNKGIRTVVTFHDNTHLNQISLGSITKKLVFGRCLSQADGIHCISQTSKKQLLETFPNLSDRRIEVIHHGMSFPNAKPARPNLCNNRPFILFVGPRCGYKKGSVALEAISKLDGFRLIFCGGGPPSRNEREYVLQNSLEESVQFLGPVSDSNLVWLYENAFVLWFPSSSEGFGFPSLEAAACGCPVLAQNGHAVEEICGDWILSTDLVSSDWLIKETISLSIDSERYKALSIDGPQLAAQYSWELYARSMKHFYESILNI